MGSNAYFHLLPAVFSAKDPAQGRDAVMSLIRDLYVAGSDDYILIVLINQARRPDNPGSRIEDRTGDREK
jgi:hypothetical protein